MKQYDFIDQPEYPRAQNDLRRQGMTKTDRLKKLLQQQWVSPLEALELTGTMALSQRCSEFIAAGMKVQKKWLKLPSGSRVMTYRLSR